MKARHLVIGAVLGTLPPVHASELPRSQPPAVPVERRVVLDVRELKAALAHIRIWTPSETLPMLNPPSLKLRGTSSLQLGGSQGMAVQTHDGATGSRPGARPQRSGVSLRDPGWSSRIGDSAVRSGHRPHRPRGSGRDREHDLGRRQRNADGAAGARAAARRNEPVAPFHRPVDDRD